MNNGRYQPTSKVSAAMLAGAITTICVWLLSELTNINIPAGVESAITVIIMAAAGWIKEERSQAYTQGVQDAQSGEAR